MYGNGNLGAYRNFMRLFMRQTHMLRSKYAVIRTLNHRMAF
jgi:hypothetical protein